LVGTEAGIMKRRAGKGLPGSPRNVSRTLGVAGSPAAPIPFSPVLAKRWWAALTGPCPA